MGGTGTEPCTRDDRDSSRALKPLSIRAVRGLPGHPLIEVMAHLAAGILWPCKSSVLKISRSRSGSDRGLSGRRPRSEPLRDRVRSTGNLVAIPLTAWMLSGVTARQSTCRVVCRVPFQYPPSHATQGLFDRPLRPPTQRFSTLTTSYPRL